MKDNLLMRLVPLAGAAYFGLEVAGNGSIGKFPEATTPIAKLLPFYAAHHSGIARGGFLLHYAALALALFLITLWARIRQSGVNPIISGAALMGAAIAVAGEFDGAAVYSTLGFIGGKQPAIAPVALQSWHVNGAGSNLITGDGGLMILLLAVGAAGVAGKVLPRWLAWPALLIGLLQLTPIGYSAEIVFWLWAGVTGVYLAIRPVAQADAHVERQTSASFAGSAP
jgi:hypothetical protein